MDTTQQTQVPSTSATDAEARVELDRGAPDRALPASPRRAFVRASFMMLAAAACARNDRGQPASVSPAAGGDVVDRAAQDSQDREAITAHLRGLFEAFLHKDREAIRRGHTVDWRGFQVKSRGIVRGIDQYMLAADQALASFSGRRYEIVDLEIQLYGDIAIVYYVADWWFGAEGEQEERLALRSVDVYRREAGGWNQCGSNISIMPDE